MPVRCPKCGATVSEWARRCTVCRADLSQGADLPAEPPEAEAVPRWGGPPLLMRPGGADRSTNAWSAARRSSGSDHPSWTSPGDPEDGVAWTPADDDAEDGVAPSWPSDAGRVRHRLAAHPRVAVVAAVALVALVVAIVANRPSAPVRKAPTAAPRPAAQPALLPAVHLPAALADYPVAYVASGQVAYATLGGARPLSIDLMAGMAQPGDRAQPEGGAAVFVGTGLAGEEAEKVDSSGNVTSLGAATGVLPGPPGEVGLALEDDDTPTGAPLSTVRVTGRPTPSAALPVSGGALPDAADQAATSALAVLAPGTEAPAKGQPTVGQANERTADGQSISVPAGTDPVAVLPDGRIALRSVQSGHLLIWSPPKPKMTDVGPLSAVVAVSNTTLAWLSSAGCATPTACPLHLLNLRTGVDRLVAPPAGEHGYAEGGQFSPDGDRLAAFVIRAATASSTSTVQTALVDPTSGRSSLVGAPLTTLVVPGLAVGVSWWTPDGAWLIYGGLTGDLYAWQPAESLVRGSNDPVDLQLPGSWGFAAL
jgi:hypothetical protein